MDEAVIKRIQPNNAEAEQAVVGAMLSDSDVISSVTEMVTADDFYLQKYALIFKAIVSLSDAGEPVDLITVQNKLNEMKAPAEVSSFDTLATVARSVPYTSNVRRYAKIVSEKATLRKLIKAVEGIADECYNDGDSLDVILDKSEKAVFEISQSRKTAEYEKISETVVKALNIIDAASKNTGSVTGVSTGFYKLDYMTAGFQKADLLLLAARPSMGKTALALNIAEHVITKSRVPTVFFSLEMSKLQLVNRLLSMNSKINAQSIRTGNLKQGEWSDLMESARIIGNATLTIDDTPSISVREMRSKCRKLKMEQGLGLIIIDYLQLMTSGSKSESRQNEVSEISRSLKALAREIDCPVLALSQLSRDVEKRDDKRPQLSDLRESGAIEQDADVVMFIYRDEYYHREKSEEKGVAEVIIGKQRNGPVGSVKLGYQLEYARFVNLAENSDQNRSSE
ncbi:MAG: replicative DNA helicase [Lachnospiraceae bacterium]|nr:replicative DNA helicase [Lachnospiraceae bacterium]